MTELTFPPEEAECVRSHYTAARVILEYGSGGSTLLGAAIDGKFLMSVESDRHWAMKLQQEVDAVRSQSRAIVWHADIGPTGAWGRPVDDRAWSRFHRYPLAIWDKPFFRSPDVVLIDGRFRPACFVTTFMRTLKPVIVLFDDYINRPQYHIIEQLAKPERIVGRMAVFHLAPGEFPRAALTSIVGTFFEASYASSGFVARTRPIC